MASGSQASGSKVAQGGLVGVIIRALIGLSLSMVTALILDYMFLPAWSFYSFGFWMLLGVVSFVVVSLLGWIIGAKWGPYVGAALGGLWVVAALVLSVGSWLIWPGNDLRLYNQLSVEARTSEDFVRDFAGASIVPRPGATVLLPTIDKELSVKLAQGKLGTYGAQFQFDENIFSSINVMGADGVQKMVRVSALDYASPFVAFGSGSKGSPGYMEVHQGTGEARMVEPSEGLRYTPGALFGYDLKRHIRYAHRTALLGEWSFEIDDQGKPFWVVPVLKNTLGFFGGTDQVASIVVDPISGEIDYYFRGEEPGWIDRVVPSNLVLEQANNHLGLKNGWMNRDIGTRKDVFQVSDGYNYIATTGEAQGGTWLITGITSPNEADQTSVGVLVVNLKTKEARSYSLPGITEMRAREIAENDERVRAQTLAATWPVLVVVQGRPTYYFLLKNSVQRQRFVLVDAENGSPVAMADTWESTLSGFANVLGNVAVKPEDLSQLTGTVLRVRDDKDDMVSFILRGDPSVRYLVRKDLGNGVLFMGPGDEVTFTYRNDGLEGEARTVVFLTNATIGE